MDIQSGECKVQSCKLLRRPGDEASKLPIKIIVHFSYCAFQVACPVSVDIGLGVDDAIVYS